MKNRIATTTFWLAVAPAVCLANSTVHAAPATQTPAAQTPAAAKAKSKVSAAPKAKTIATPKAIATPTATTVPTPVVDVPAATAPPVATPTGPPVNSVVVSVNNDKLLRADLERAVDAIKASDKSLQTGTEAANKALATIRQNQIDNWINNRLLLQEAAKRRITATPSAVDVLVKAAKKQFPTPAAYQAFLKSGGKTEASLRKFYNEQLVLDELTKRLVADFAVGDADIKKFYATPSGGFEIPNQARAHHILLNFTPKMTADDKAKLRAQAAEILQKAQAPGADFNALIKQYSQDPGAEYDGGDTGSFSQEESFKEMKPFADAVFAAQSGQIIGPIETAFGFHIVRVDEASRKPVLDRDLKATIRGFLIKQRVGQKLEAIIAQNKKTAVIKTNV